MNFVGVGVPELILIAVLALIFVGPQKLPEVMGQIGRTVREIRRQASEVTRQFTDEFDDIRDDYRDVRGDLSGMRDEVTGMRDEMKHETDALNRELRSTVTDARKAVEAPIEATARVVDDVDEDPQADEPGAAAEPPKVVRMQRRSSKRQLPSPESRPTNTNT